MRTRIKARPTAEYRVGRKFRARPSDAVILEFVQHVWRTGSPQTWRWITTTPHPEGEAPIILKRFEIPARLRHGRDTRAPCSVCSPDAPKFDDGYLVYCADGFIRIIGHDCGHEFFGDSYDRALIEHREETAEATARALLAERLPELTRTLLKAITVGRRMRALLDFRERAFATITLTAVNAMRRSRIGDQLTVDVETRALDEKGRRIIERLPVATVPGLDGLTPGDGVLGELVRVIPPASQQIVPRDELQERLQAMSRQEVFGSARAVRDLDRALEKATQVHANLAQLLLAPSLKELDEWGRHAHSPKPFWIEVVGRRVFLGKGLKPRTWDRGAYLQLPDDENLETVIVL